MVATIWDGTWSATATSESRLSGVHGLRLEVRARPPSNRCGRKDFAGAGRCGPGMKPENRGPVVPIVCFAVGLAVAVTCIFYISTIPGLPTLPLPAGTVIRPSYRGVGFTVEGGPANLVGAWYAPEGGAVVVRPADDTRPVGVLVCVEPWNGTISQSFVPGHYVMFFAQGGQGGIVITHTLQLVYPGSPKTSSSYSNGSCG
jgi:hypothetical protein